MTTTSAPFRVLVNCRTAFSFIAGDGCCPDCGPVKLRPATITVEPHDADKVAATTERDGRSR